MVNIFTDSTADLGPELAKRFNIQVIPLYVYLEDKTFADGVDISSADLFRSVASKGKLPLTSAPTVPDFQRYFDLPGESLYIGLSSRLSATMQNAVLAQQSCPDGSIYLVDSLNLSSGIGLLALKAADLRDQGLPAAEIARQVGELVPHIRTSFMIETLDYLYKGGRCSAMQNLMGSLLHIRPVIAVRPDGTLGVKGRTRGSRQKGLLFMLDDFIEHMAEINLERVCIAHTGCMDDAQFLKQALLDLAPIQEVLISSAGSVIASHCGPETIGIMYLRN